jgi:hypothetical protein
MQEIPNSEKQTEKKIDQKKERAKKKKKERKQTQKLNNMSEGRWQRLGSFASWVGYRVSIGDNEELIPVRRNTSTPQLINIMNNVKRAVRKEKALEAEKKKKKKARKNRTL